MLFGWLRRVAGGFLVGVAWMLVCYVWLRWVFVAVCVDCGGCAGLWVLWFSCYDFTLVLLLIV